MAVGPRPKMLIQKPKNFRGTLKRLIRELALVKGKLILVILFVVASVILGVGIPKILIKATNYLATPFNIDFGVVGEVILTCVFLYLISNIFTYISSRIMAKASQQVVKGLRTKLRNKLSLLPLKYFDENQVGVVLSTFTNDTDNISNGLQQSITQFLSSIITMIGVIVIMLSINVWLTLIMVAIIPVSILLSGKLMKASQKKFIEQQKNLGELNGHIEEVFNSHKVVKVNNQEKFEQAKFEQINVKLTDSSQKSQFLAGLMYPIVNFVSNAGFVTIAVVCCIFISDGVLQFGALTAALQYAQQFSQPIGQIGQIVSVIQNTIAGAERVFAVLDQTEEVADEKNALTTFDFANDITFKNVDFSYSQDKPLFKNVSLSVRRGEIVALVGKTGAGKTTIVNLLMRFYELGGGEILIDGVNIRNISKNTLRKNIGMVLQDTWLFNGTIRDNIAFGKSDASEEEIVAAATAAQCDHFINTLPHGYNTIINEDASNISSGQKQLLTIARALLVSPKILILDEATSSVDTRTELLIQKAMKTLMQGRTSFVIAHRLSTITSADKILVMENGNIVEEGSHSKLLENKSGAYYALWNSNIAVTSEDK